ncbi:hypothetical protein HDV00_010469 [Rhizophlyctis rosea]|nr:hypothetical protein HDV00_010469 [Rhizophlyctis rosea]
MIAKVVPQEYVRPLAEIAAERPSYYEIGGDEVRNFELVKSYQESAAGDFYLLLHRLVASDRDTSIRSHSREHSQEFHSTADHKDEVTAEQVLKVLINKPVNLKEEFSGVNGLMKFAIVDCLHGSVNLLGTTVEASNDGYISIQQQGRDGKFRQMRKLVACFVQAKWGQHNKADDQIFGQLAAEALWTAQINHAGRSGDQEVFAIGIHHRKAHILNVSFPGDYLRRVETNAGPNNNDCITIKRSVEFDILDKGSRLQFIAQLDGIMNYIVSGTSLVGLMQGTETDSDTSM